MTRLHDAVPARLFTSAALLAGVAAVGLGGVGCTGTAPSGNFAFQVKNHSDAPQPRAAFRNGFDFNRINEDLPTAWRDKPVYDSDSPKPLDQFAAASAARPTAPAYAFVGGTGGERVASTTAPSLDDDFARASAGQGGGGSFDIPQVASATLPRNTTYSAVVTTPADAPVLVVPSPRADEISVADFDLPVSAPSPAPAPAASGGAQEHTIQKGDSFWKLAQRYYGSGARFQDIARANPDMDPKKLQVGQTLIIPE